MFHKSDAEAEAYVVEEIIEGIGNGDTEAELIQEFGEELFREALRLWKRRHSTLRTFRG